MKNVSPLDSERKKKNIRDNARALFPVIMGLCIEDPSTRAKVITTGDARDFAKNIAKACLGMAKDFERACDEVLGE